MIFDKALKIMLELLELKDEQNYLHDPLPEEREIIKDIPYLEDETKEHLLDIIYPKKYKENYPFIINIHGGGFMMNSKEKIYENYSKRLAYDTFAVVNINYRLSIDHPFPAQIEDVLAVLSFLSKHAKEYQLDLQYAFLCGDSAGAYLAAYACCILNQQVLRDVYKFYDNFSIRAVALQCGLYDFTSASSKEIEFHLIRQIIERLFNDMKYQELDIYPYTSVLKYINDKFPPAYIMDTQIESFAPEAIHLYEQLYKHGVTCKIHIYGKEYELGHDFQVWEVHEQSAIVRDEVLTFFKSYV